MVFERSLMTYLGIQPWRVIRPNKSSPPELKELSLQKLIVIQFFNLVWCVPLVIWIGYLCFDPSVRKALEDTSTNNMEYMVVIIALTINWLIAPIGHLILTVWKKSQMCDFYNANKDRLERYDIGNVQL